jgi:Xaa-Pro aminopeptidase
VLERRRPEDGRVTPQLHAAMAEAWGPVADTHLPEVDPVAPLAARRRQQLSAVFPGETLVVPTGAVKNRSNDQDFVFRAGSDFAWLVGDLEPGRVLVMVPEGEGHRSVVYVRERGAHMPTAWEDVAGSELNAGPRRGPSEVAAGFAVATAPLGERAEALAGLSGSVRVVRGLDPTVDAAVAERADADTELVETLAELRMVKDAWELAQLEEAVVATVLGFEECVREIPTALGERGERWIEGTFWRRARMSGNDVGYTSIVACGAHATAAHWTRDDGPVRPGELLLLDMGVETDRLYTADITRTFPVDGRFTPDQRELYDAVWRAQDAGIEAVRPGATFGEVYEAAMRVLVEALAGWGLVTDPVEQVLADCTHRRWTLSRISHHLGLDVHDCTAVEDGPAAHPLREGMVITVEPGQYLQHHDQTVPERWRGVGIRLEDDVLVTAPGHRVLSDALPPQADEVERWMARLWSA